MLKTRIIPCLLLQQGGLVKTRRFAHPKYIGDPLNAVKIFNEKSVDELIFLDIEASKKNYSPNLEIISDLASECFMPFAYGGGIKTLQQIEKILNIGVEKVVINSAFIAKEQFIAEAARHFGSSTIIVAIDVKKDVWRQYKIYDHIQKRILNESPVNYAKRASDLGAGELFINCVDGDGTYGGFDATFFREINRSISTPLIACGGASSLADIKKLVDESGVAAVAAGSLFVYQGPHHAVLISYPTQMELRDLFNDLNARV